MRLQILFTMILFSLCNLTQAATVYKKVDENGNLVFSDTPMDDAEELDVPPVPTMKLPKIQPPTTKPRAKKGPFSYQLVAITAPQQDENFINNQGQVTVTVQINPKLRKGDGVQLLFNGVKRAGPSANMSFDFSNLDRGTYTATAQVVDDKGNVVTSSETVSFHVKRAFKRAP